MKYVLLAVGLASAFTPVATASARDSQPTDAIEICRQASDVLLNFERQYTEEEAAMLYVGKLELITRKLGYTETQKEAVRALCDMYLAGAEDMVVRVQYELKQGER